MIRFILFLYVLSYSCIAFAVEDIHAEHRYSGKVAFGGLKTTGNSPTETFDSLLELEYEYQAWQASFDFSGTQTSSDGKLTSDYYEANLKGVYNFQWQTYGFTLINYREDFFGGIHSEISKLYGVGYHVFEAHGVYTLDLEVGTGQRETDKVNKNKLDVDPITHGAMIMIYQPSDANKIKAKITIEDGNDDSFIKKEVSWAHALFASFEVDISYESRTLTAPAFGKTGTDSTTSIVLGYAF